MTDIPSNLDPDDELQPSLKDRRKAFWAQFNVDVPTEAHGMQALLETTVQSSGPECTYCQTSDVTTCSDNRKVRCNTCKKTWSLTAGTFFHNIRKPRAWLAAIRLMESGLTPSVAEFFKDAGVGYATAWNICRKLGIVVEQQMAGAAEVVASSSFAPAICRRSRETPARAHPIAETLDREEEAGDGNVTMAPIPADEPSGSSPVIDEGTLATRACTGVARSDPAETLMDSQTAGNGETIGLTCDEKHILDLLSNEPVHFDVLLQRCETSTSKLSAALTMLEFAGAARCIAGHRYVRISEEKDGDTAGSQRRRERDGTAGKSLPGVHAIIEFLRGTFKGVACKYLQLYLAAFWCHMDKVRWPCGSLLSACQHANPITDAEVLAYVSPAFVRVACPMTAC